MGAGQIGGIATLLDIDFNNAAGFQGVDVQYSEGQFVAHYLSHALLFCLGALIEPHVVLTPALCVFGEKYKFDVYAGTHNFLRNAGIQRIAEHVCIHKGYNHTQRWTACSPVNLGLLVLNKPFSFHEREPNADFVVNRLRYGPTLPLAEPEQSRGKCHYFGFGSRRNGYLLPLLIKMRKVEVVILAADRCVPMWNKDNQFLCIQHIPCKDDVGSVLECSGFAIGMMVSRLIDRPCGVGFIDLRKNLKFLTCGVDDARDVISNSDQYFSFDFGTTLKGPATSAVITVPTASIQIENDATAIGPTEESMETENIILSTTSTTETTEGKKNEITTTTLEPRKAVPEPMENDNDESIIQPAAPALTLSPAHVFPPTPPYRPYDDNLNIYKNTRDYPRWITDNTKSPPRGPPSEIGLRPPRRPHQPPPFLQKNVPHDRPIRPPHLSPNANHPDRITHYGPDHRIHDGWPHADHPDYQSMLHRWLSTLDYDIDIYKPYFTTKKYLSPPTVRKRTTRFRQ